MPCTATPMGRQHAAIIGPALASGQRLASQPAAQLA